MTTLPLAGVEALLFDVFGTVVDWEHSVSQELRKRCERKVSGGKHLADLDWVQFTKEWRGGYLKRTREISQGAPGPTDVDVLHREILDDLLQRPEWSVMQRQWDEQEKIDINLSWHRLEGWPDSSEALENLKSRVVIATLSNGSARLLIDMAKFAGLDWDMIFSGDALESYKPNPKMYIRACELLGYKTAEERNKVAMVASHLYDLQAAKEHGLRTVYVVDRPTEDIGIEKQTIKSKAEGGEVDAVVENLAGLASLVEENLRSVV